MNRLNSEFTAWILEDGYGKVLSRPGLSLAERELIAVAVLAASGWKRQLNSHIIGGLNVGVTLHQLHSVLSTVTPLIARERAANFRAQVRSVKKGQIKKTLDFEWRQRYIHLEF